MQVDVRWVDSEDINDSNAAELLAGCAGINRARRFWEPGIEGISAPSCRARENQVPYLGICLGMQMAVVEFARHVAGLADAHSSELAATAHPVIDLMPDQQGITDKGGTMRLGAYPCYITTHDTRAYQAYGAEDISERHRHRYEFNNDFRSLLTEKGLVLSGLSPDREASGDGGAAGIIPGSWPSSSTRSSSPGRIGPIPCSGTSSPRQRITAGAGPEKR